MLIKILGQKASKRSPETHKFSVFVIKEPLVKYENKHNKPIYSNAQHEPMCKPSHTKSTGT